MNDVMKKRLIGVAVLVGLGVLAPLLLSRCMLNGDEDNGRGSMRVYNVQSDGNAEPADNSPSNPPKAADQNTTPDQTPSVASANNSGQSGGGQPKPDAVSPQSKSDFSTPPVHGASGRSANSSAQPKNPASAANSEGGRHQSGTSSRDYGAASVGAGSSSGGQRSSGSNTSPSVSSSTPASGPEKSSIQGWVVQVASFSDQGNATDLAKKLQGQFAASYTPAQVNGKTWYRVNVGPFDSRQAAQSAADQLSQAGHKGLVRHLR